MAKDKDKLNVEVEPVDVLRAENEKLAEALKAAEEKAAEAETRAKAAEDAALTEAQNLLNSAEVDIHISEEAAALGIKGSRVKMSSYKEKDSGKISKEEARHQKLVQQRIKNRIAKAKALARMEPIDKRMALLKGRFKAVRAKNRAYTYSEELIKAYREEFDLIKNNPKRWNDLTANGTKPYVPGTRVKKTPKQQLDELDLE